MNDIDVEVLLNNFRQNRETLRAQRVQEKTAEHQRKVSRMEEMHQYSVDRITARSEGALLRDQMMEERYRRDVEFTLSTLRDPSPFMLRQWMTYDMWRPSEAFLLILGYDPTYTVLDEAGQIPDILIAAETDRSDRFERYRVTTLSNLNFDSAAFADIVGEKEIRQRHFFLQKDFAWLKEAWERGSHGEGPLGPAYYINWALSKNFTPDWLQEAIEKGHYIAQSGAQTEAPKNADSEGDKQVNAKSEGNYLNIIGALLDLYWNAAYPDEKKLVMAKVLTDLETYSDFSGLGERNLKDKLPQALRRIRSE